MERNASSVKLFHRRVWFVAQLPMSAAHAQVVSTTPAQVTATPAATAQTAQLQQYTIVQNQQGQQMLSVRYMLNTFTNCGCFTQCETLFKPGESWLMFCFLLCLTQLFSQLALALDTLRPCFEQA